MRNSLATAAPQGVSPSAAAKSGETHQPAAATATEEKAAENKNDFWNTLLQALFFDEPVPHDNEFRFDVLCPEDETTCSLIEDHSAWATSRVTNPDPRYEPPVFRRKPNAAGFVFCCRLIRSTAAAVASFVP